MDFHFYHPCGPPLVVQVGLAPGPEAHHLMRITGWEGHLVGVQSRKSDGTCSVQQVGNLIRYCMSIRIACKYIQHVSLIYLLNLEWTFTIYRYFPVLLSLIQSYGRPLFEDPPYIYA